ncbi:TIGR03016 family PEP-CTERM system-associated outer membrane protein [Quisquiliibacterium transsilvanicum]|jgi:uncharacterized protein (PEP-CTERM system associated)|uniref:Uncharacterized protein (PEP-CTERM system associated) n=1 Tax=Quisquiliibacterium transsilvanicum TaxID=1549638 RepID=A0A7W8HF32_9BURK|nr:TIGR03016 family PEP-CTERM system-associated outer membrane protein [Quisquiliibacterium transsilvanicum]MBB5270045.1 uncharacterized protein (PEP-CTERM system associated) [Quisquiliibacterium transsilvanicum]
MVRHRKLGGTLAVSIALLFSGGAFAQDSGSSSGGGSSGSSSAGGSSASGTTAGSGDALSSGGGGGLSAFQDLRFLPGLRVAQTFSDNILRRSDGNEKAGFVTEVSPYVHASVNKARLQGDLRFSVRNFYRSETAPGADSLDLLRYALRANGSARAPGDRYGIDASAFIQDIALSPFGVTSSDTASLQSNRRRYSGLEISPYLTGRLGSNASYRADYSLRMNNVSGGNVLGLRADHRLNASIGSGPRFSGWGWSLSGQANEREYKSGLTAGRTSAAANLWYALNPELRLGVSANYMQIDRLNIDGKDYGVGPGVSVVWAPSSRTSLSAQWVDQFYGTNSSLSVSHSARRFNFGLAYSRGVVSGSDAALLLFNPSAGFGGSVIVPDRGPIVTSPALQELLESGDPVLAASLTTDVAVYQKRLTANVGYQLPRGALLLTVYRTTRDTAVRNTLGEIEFPEFTGSLQQRGVRLSLNTRLDMRSSLRFTVRRQDTESATTDRTSRFTTMSASYITNLTSDTSAGIGVRRSVQKVSGATGFSGYDENAIFGSLDTRF